MLVVDTDVDKVVDLILGEAKPTDKKVTREELLKMPDDGEPAVPGTTAG